MDPNTWTAAFAENGDAAAVLASRSTYVTGLVEKSYQAHLAPLFPTGMAALAVGGYGRRELFPHSDVDLLLLVQQIPEAPAVKEALSIFMRELWDSGLRLSHSVHTVDECCQLHAGNLELSISLIDVRFLCGDQELYGRLTRKWPQFVAAERTTLIKDLVRQSRERHRKFQNTVYHLEPNLKEAPGGLRDLHLIWWLSRLQDPHKALPDWLGELGQERQFLDQIRCFLHFQAGRDQNLFQFDLQEQACGQPFAMQRNGGAALTRQQLMRIYYRNARLIHRSSLQALDVSETLVPSGLFSAFKEWRQRLSNSEISVTKERLFLKDPTALERDPDIALRLIRFSARHGIPLATETERRMTSAFPAMASHFASSRPTWNYLREIFLQPHARLGIRAMQETRLLEAIFPEWQQIEALVVRDFHHRYTVDEHTLIVMENLLGLAKLDDPKRNRFQDLFQEMDTLPLVLLAMVFHDIGKAIDEPTHPQISAGMVDQAMQRIQVPEEERELVHFLVEQHLALSSVMNTRDLTDPATGQYVAEKVGTRERLRDLTLFTYSDMGAVSPQAMTPWRLDQLWRLYSVTLRELTAELESDRITLEEAPAEGREFWEGLPQRYLRTHSTAEIHRHFELAQQAQHNGAALDLVRQGGVWQLTVISQDRPGLFAALAGALSGSGMDIVRAEAYANAKGSILDQFTFNDPGRNLELNPPEIDRLKGTLEKVIGGVLDPRALLSSRRRANSAIPRGRLKPAVSFDNEISAHATFVEIVAEDRPGLLFDLASTLFQDGLNIEVVLIDTEMNKAIDVFYVTKNGEKLTLEQEDGLRAALLEACQ